jgi:hypothetical protein
LNRTPLPLACFRDEEHPNGSSADYLDTVASGAAWISTTRLAGGLPLLRTCITNYRTGMDDLDALVADLDWARILV